MVTTPTTTAPAAATPASTVLPSPAASTPATLSNSSKSWKKWGVIGGGSLLAIAGLIWAFGGGHGRSVAGSADGQTENTVTHIAAPVDQCNVQGISVTAPPMTTSNLDDAANWSTPVPSRGEDCRIWINIPRDPSVARIQGQLPSGKWTDCLNGCENGVNAERYGSNTGSAIYATATYKPRNER